MRVITVGGAGCTGQLLQQPRQLEGGGGGEIDGAQVEWVEASKNARAPRTGNEDRLGLRIEGGFGHA